ncbi:copper resistance CopC family protein [Microbispora sp. ATCC PTA-5024]|uniref:copper resistance CopC family protein n=1 Tax=Microbispora sp. ATCC PTA-5024 TaxID=316330 RepID=UPI0003DD556B|nr:copper resistance CopC family protein [Microbispora sp. ATCC PTA-5024]ETK32295.1 hypothetical protein MPTA5024_30345 [Microbispora sp. ATCC PTA-5024]
MFEVPRAHGRGSTAGAGGRASAPRPAPRRLFGDASPRLWARPAVTVEGRASRAARALPAATRAAGRAIAALVLALLATAAPLASPASAHNVLIGSDPQQGARLAALPNVVTLTFDQAVRRDFARIAVTGPGGAHYEQGEVGTSGAGVFISVRPAGPAGDYSIGYRIVSNDGHPVTGTITFTVTGGTGGAAPPSGSESGGTPATGAGRSLEVPGSSGGWVWGLLVATAALLALAIRVLVRHDRRLALAAGGAPAGGPSGPVPGITGSGGDDAAAPTTSAGAADRTAGSGAGAAEGTTPAIAGNGGTRPAADSADTGAPAGGGDVPSAAGENMTGGDTTRGSGGEA